ncbi:MAG: hypothetical protein JWN17_2273 [Frankiales bacterium]|nr:hypothetical protein [Frankiales bacterium]
MARRPLLLVLLAAALTTAAGAGTSFADPSPTGLTASGEHRVCPDPAPGHVTCFVHVRTKGGDVVPDATTSYSSGYSPAQLQKAYGLTPGASAPLVAVVDAYANPNAAADLATYRSQFGLGTANLTQVNQAGGTLLPAGDTGWGQEEMLDLEMVSATCPACPILYVGASSTSFADLAAAVDTAVAKGAKVVSNSYGGTESSSVATYAKSYDHPGVAITVSSGDSGYGVQSPASYGTVTAVGGTNLVLNADGTRQAETAWSGAGSGCSGYVTKPSWQKDAGCAKRTVADVSAVADPATGVAVYDSYGSTGGANWFVFGGTSVAAPIIGGVYALSGNTAGVPASLAYTSPTGTLFDVTSGSNGRCVRGKTTSGAYLCTAGTGYDGPTGVGAPKGTAGF